LSNKPLTCDDAADGDTCPACKQAEDFSLKIAAKIIEMCRAENMTASQAAQSTLYAALTMTSTIAANDAMAVNFVSSIVNSWIEGIAYDTLQNSELKSAEIKGSVANTITGNRTKH
jgi:hydroxylamine reductase (hybrid-cluster protein)